MPWCTHGARLPCFKQLEGIFHSHCAASNGNFGITLEAPVGSACSHSKTQMRFQKALYAMKIYVHLKPKGLGFCWSLYKRAGGLFI